MSNDENILKIVAAINLRNHCRSGLEDLTWIREQAMALVEIGFWNDPQIASICQLTRQAVTSRAKELGIVRSATPIQPGRLDAGALDGILELCGNVRRGEKHNQLVLQAVIKTRTSTKLIAALTGLTIGQVLHAQRQLRKV